MINRNNLPILYFFVMMAISLILAVVAGIFLNAPYIGMMCVTFTVFSTALWYFVLWLLGRGKKKNINTNDNSFSDDW